MPQNHIARKRFGQHFLSDSAFIDQIVRAIAPKAGQAVVEIGPGLMALTQPLLERLGQLTVIELDRDLAARLRQRQGLQVVEADVLKVDWSALPRPCAANDTPQRWRVVGNLPYNISSPILFHLADFGALIEDQHFMLQKEVVDRMVAAPGTSAYGRLSVMLQVRYDMENLFDVPPNAFDPPPKVMSSVVRMLPKSRFVDPTEKADASTEGLGTKIMDTFGELVKVAFSQRRKLLRHSLGRWLEEKQFAGLFDVQRRAEEVSVEEYWALAQALGTNQG